MTHASPTHSTTGSGAHAPSFLRVAAFTLVFGGLFAAITFGLGVDADDSRDIETVIVLVIALGVALLRKHRTGSWSPSPEWQQARGRKFGSTRWAVEWLALDLVIAIVAAVIAKTWIVAPFLFVAFAISELADMWFWRRIGRIGDRRAAQGQR